MEQRPDQPPEGRLIADAADRLSLSIREAARRAGISYGRWRQITSGYQNVSPGVYGAVHAPARTLARMAQAVNVSPEELESAGRPDAAAILRDLPETEAQVIRLPVGADDPIRKVLAVQRILGGPIDPDDTAEQELLRLPMSPEGIAAEILKLRKIRAEYSAGGLGTPRRDRR